MFFKSKSLIKTSCQIKLSKSSVKTVKLLKLYSSIFMISTKDRKENKYKNRLNFFSHFSSSGVTDTRVRANSSTTTTTDPATRSPPLTNHPHRHTLPQSRRICPTKSFIYSLGSNSFRKILINLVIFKLEQKMCYFTHSVRRGFVTILKRATKIGCNLFTTFFSRAKKTKLIVHPRLNKNLDGKINLGVIKLTTSM